MADCRIGSYVFSDPGPGRRDHVSESLVWNLWGMDNSRREQNAGLDGIPGCGD